MTDELRVMASGSAEPALDFVAAAYARATGHRVLIAYNKEVPDFDVVLASADAIERKFKPHDLVISAEEIVGAVGLGVAVRDGLTVPDVSTLSGLLDATRLAERIIITDNHSSGLYMEATFQRLGLLESIGERIEKQFNAPHALNRLAGGKGLELLFLSMNEIMTYRDKGVVLAGPLPDEIQYVRRFVAVPATASSRPEIAADFVRFCAEDARSIFREHGFSQET